MWFHEIGPRYDCYLSNSLILCHSRGDVEFIFRVLTFTRKSLWKLKLNTLPGRMLLIRKDSIKKKYQNGTLTSSDAPKKLARKPHILTLYRASHSEDLRILDLQSISIGFHTVKMYHFWTNFFGASEEVREPFWYFFFIESFRIKSIRPGNIFPFNFQRDFGLNIDSRKIKKGK